VKIQLGTNCPNILRNADIVSGAKTIVFDRDGTINVDKGYVHQISDFRLTDQFLDVLNSLNKFEGNICIMTNQGGVALGKYLESDSHLFTEYLISTLKRYGVNINLVISCYHHDEDDCEYRKPASAMLREIESIVQSDTTSYLYIGNDQKDAQVAKDRNIRYLDVRSINFVEDFDCWLDTP